MMGGFMLKAQYAGRSAEMLRRCWPIPAMIAVSALALVLFQSLSRMMDYHAVMRAMHGMSALPILGAVAATAASYAALLARDATILRYTGARVPAAALIVGAVCGSALGNLIGFGPLSGGAVRLRVYGAVGIGARQVARLMALITISFGAGLLVLAAASAVSAPGPVGAAVGLPPGAMRIAGAAVLILTCGALALCRGGATVGLGRWRIAWPTRSFALTQLAIVAADVFSAGLVLWLLLPAGTIGVVAFMAIFAAATAAGVLSHVPGGFGVFETVVAVAIGHAAPPGPVLAALVVYRLVYFFLPILLSCALLVAFELRRLSARAAPSPALLRVGRVAGRLAPQMLGLVTFAIGVMLMLSGATPGFSHRLALLQMTLPLWVVESSHFLESLLGVLLLFVARGLQRRLDGAWWTALGITCASLVLSLAKGLAFVEAGILLCLILLLIGSRRRFDRPAWLLREPFTPTWFVAIASVVAITVGLFLFAFRDVTYCHEMWWEFAFDAKAPRALRATVAAAVLAAVIALRQLLRLAPGRAPAPTQADLDAAAAILRGQYRSDAMLALMRDKSFLFNEARTAFVMYAKRGRSWVALYDPIGKPAEWAELIRRFIALAHRHGGRAAFYQVRPETLSLYLDAGLHIMKLGEEACLDLGGFTLQGPARRNLRYAVQRGERDGLSFELIAPENVPAILPVLRGISDLWMSGRKDREKGFSVAWFEPGYVAAQSVALVREANVPVAFATCMATDLQGEATIGLMRHVRTASPYAMEYLFTKLALTLRDSGFERLSLGVAPLAGLAANPLASTWHRIGGLLWDHANGLYDFQGLRRFKNKFAPRWEPRYLAASGAVGPFLAMADVVALTAARALPGTSRLAGEQT